MTQDITTVEEKNMFFDVESLIKKSGTRTANKTRAILEKLASEAQAIARPQAVAMRCTLIQIEDDQIEEDQLSWSQLEDDPLNMGQIELNGVRLTSSFIKEKLTGLTQVFPYVATEGPEMSAWGTSYNGQLEMIFAHSLQQMAAKQAKTTLENILLEKYNLPQLSTLNPGSLLAWPITQQKPLFKILGPWPQQLGITLLPSFMMNPQHTVSGIFFQTDTKYHNCELCSLEDCPNRRVPSQVM